MTSLLWDPEQIVGYYAKIVSVCTELVHEGRLYDFYRKIMLCGDIRTELVEH